MKRRSRGPEVGERDREGADQREIGDMTTVTLNQHSEAGRPKNAITAARFTRLH